VLTNALAVVNAGAVALINKVDEEAVRAAVVKSHMWFSGVGNTCPSPRKNELHEWPGPRGCAGAVLDQPDVTGTICELDPGAQDADAAAATARG
jgi:hypothetical protein